MFKRFWIKVNVEILLILITLTEKYNELFIKICKNPLFEQKLDEKD